MILNFKNTYTLHTKKLGFSFRETSAAQTAAACFQKKLFHFLKTAFSSFGGVK